MTHNLLKKAKEVCYRLEAAGKILSTAESCTGGMIGEMLTAIPGSSAVYGYGFITYSNEAKMSLLGVKKSTLDSFGAVSEQTVEEMAVGALEKSGADIAVSVSGIAGPGGGTKEKPVGLVCVGLACKGSAPTSLKLFLEGDRTAVRQKTVENVFDIILKNI